MVDLNFTLVLQLLMFLGFLWVMDRWVLRPLLKTMDQREHEMSRDKDETVVDQESAETLEQEYATALAKAHQNAYRKIAESLREVQNRQFEERDELRQLQQEEVAKAHAEANAFLDQERGNFPELSQAIARGMMSQLGLGGNAS